MLRSFDLPVDHHLACPLGLIVDPVIVFRAIVDYHCLLNPNPKTSPFLPAHRFVRIAILFHSLSSPWTLHESQAQPSQPSQSSPISTSFPSGLRHLATVLSPSHLKPLLFHPSPSRSGQQPCQRMINILEMPTAAASATASQPTNNRQKFRGLCEQTMPRPSTEAKKDLSPPPSRTHVPFADRESPDVTATNLVPPASVAIVPTSASTPYRVVVASPNQRLT